MTKTNLEKLVSIARAAGLAVVQNATSSCRKV